MKKYIVILLFRIITLHFFYSILNVAYATGNDKENVLFGIVIATAIIIIGIGFATGLVLGLLNDIVDFLGPGMIPVAGDVFDIIVIVAQVYKYGPIGFIGIVELVPMVDIVPVFSGVSVYAISQKQSG